MKQSSRHLFYLSVFIQILLSMSVTKKIQSHENDQIKVQFDPNICEHAAKCVNGLPEVFNVKARPWIQIDNSTADKIAEVIDSCPSGALTYERKDVKQAVAAEVSATEVTIIPNGPLRLSGNVVVKDEEGTVLAEASKMSLCRCGFSQNKPFCDGSHKKEGWQS